VLKLKPKTNNGGCMYHVHVHVHVCGLVFTQLFKSSVHVFDLSMGTLQSISAFYYKLRIQKDVL